MHNEEIAFLREKAKGKDVLEIGCWLGRTTVHFLEVCKNLTIIDTFRGVLTIDGDKQPEIIKKLNSEGKTLFGEFLKNLGRHDAGNKNVEILKMSSEEAAARQSLDRKFDFIFIDADHRYEMVKQDIEMWLSHLSKKGIIAGHDYNTEPGVRKAVDEMFSSAIHGPISIWHVNV